MCRSTQKGRLNSKPSFLCVYLIVDIRKTDHVGAAFAHDGYAVAVALSVLVENTFGVAMHAGVYAVIGGYEIACRFKKRIAFFLVGGVGKAVGVSAHVDRFGATAIAFVVLAVFQSAFDVFHVCFSL